MFIILKEISKKMNIIYKYFQKSFDVLIVLSL